MAAARPRDDILEGYKSYNLRKVWFLLLLAVVLGGLFAFSVATGAVYIPLDRIWAVLLGSDTGAVRAIVWNIRLPRALGAVVAGAGLAVAGTAMQSILSNPLGSPFTLGISHAAAFGAALAIVLGAGSFQAGSGSLVLSDPQIITAAAFICSLVSTLVVLFLAALKRANPESMVLAGVALGSLFTAGTTALQYVASDIQLAAVVFWTFGNLGRLTWGELGVMAATVVPVALYFLTHGWSYSVLDEGEETAQSLGVHAGRLRLVGMLLASLVTSVVVSFVGIIGFVGLVVPHMVRKLIGDDERFVLPGACLGGAVLLLAADTAARTVAAPLVLPVGILTSFLGAPLFIYLVLKGRDYYW